MMNLPEMNLQASMMSGQVMKKKSAMRANQVYSKNMVPATSTLTSVSTRFSGLPAIGSLGQASEIKNLNALKPQ